MNRFSLVLYIIIFAGSFNLVWAEESSGEFTCSFDSDIYESTDDGELILFTNAQDIPFSYEHHSCSHDKCLEDCELGYFDKLGVSYAAELPSKLLDTLSDCLCKQGKCVASDKLKKVYDGVKTGKCAYTCTVKMAQAKDDMEKVRAKAECFRCQLAGAAGNIPGGKCVVGLYNELGDLLVPHSDCLSECLGKPQTWDNNRGHPCRDAITPDRFACFNTPKGSFVVEETCKDCQWSNEKYDENIGENVLNIKKWCSSGTTCKMGSDGRPSCKPPDPKKPKHPGGDKPDDNFDVSSLFIKAVQSNTSDYDYLRNLTPDIAILDRGFPSLIMNTLTELNETANFITVEYLPFLDPIDYPLLIIPTGGLYGLDSSNTFKSWLWDYVDSGGNLIVFTQQHGYEFNALPGNNITGYGWLEDQSCQYGSVAISTYNPLFAGFESTRLDVNVDGFFTSYPENASVLLTRTKNGMPAMIMYRYGKGTVLASTLYSDMSVALHQGSNAEKILIRDIITWGRKGADTESYALGTVDFSMDISNPFIGPLSYPLPEYQTGDLIDLPVNVTNFEPNGTDKISFVLMDPYLNVTWINVTEIMQGYDSKFVNLTYNTGSTNKSGIWTILYILYNGSQEITWGFGGEFGLDYSVDYLSNFTAIVTIRDPEKNKMPDNKTNLTVLPNEKGSLNYTFSTDKKGMWSTRYSVLDQDGTVFSSGTYPFAVSDFKGNEGGYSYQGSKIALTVTSDDEWYPYGSPARFTFHLWNFDTVARDITVTWGLAHHLGNWYDKYNRTITVNASGYETFEYILPRVIDLDRLRARFYSDGGMGGTAEKGIWMFKPDIGIDIITDEKNYLRGQNVSVSFNISNLKGEIYSRCSGQGTYIGIPGAVSGCSIYMRPLPINDTSILINVIGPDNEKIPVDLLDVDFPLIMENLSDVDFPEGFTGKGQFKFILPGDAKPGLYTLKMESGYYGYKIGHNTTFFEIKNVPLELKFNSSWYRIRDTLGFEIFINNILPFSWNQTINISIPDLNYSNTTFVSLESGENTTISYSLQLPENLGVGNHLIKVTKEEEKSEKYFGFAVPESRLEYSLEKTSYFPGENIGVKIENTGGVDTTYNYSAILQDPYIATLSTRSNVGPIKAGESIIINHTLPAGAINGTYFLRIELENLRTNEKLKSIELLSLDGLAALLDLKTDKKVYSTGDNISIISKITSLNGPINGAFLNLSILSKELPQQPQQPCVIPHDDLFINESTTLCPGVYNIPDPGKNGVIRINAPGITLEGSDTVIIGTSSGSGWSGERGIYNPYHENVIIKNLEVRNYYFGMRIEDSENNTLENNTVTGCSFAGVYLGYSHNAIVRNNNISFNGWDGIGVEADGALIEKNILSHNNFGIRFYSDAVSHIIRNNQINSNNRDGIYLSDPYPYNYNITIFNNSISRNTDSGIYFYESEDNSILNNTIDDNGDYGIYFSQAKNNTLIGNSISGSPCNFYLYAYWMDEFYHNLHNNSINGRPLYFLKGASNQVIDSSIDPAMVWIVNGSNITVRDVTLKNNSHGILFVNTNGSTIENVTVSNMFEAGIGFHSSHYNEIVGASANGSIRGVYIISSENNTFINNSAGSNTMWGFEIRDSRGTELMENLAGFNRGSGGIFISGSPSSMIVNNTLKSNKYHGIDASYCSDSIISGNYFTGQSGNGFILSNSNNCKIINNTADSNSGSGFSLSGSTNLQMKNNTITGNQKGMSVHSNTQYSTFESNVIISSNYNGLIIVNAHNNVFRNNTVSNNKNKGIRISGSHGNNFENNTINFNKNPAWWSVDGTAIYISNSDNNTFTKNNASQNYDGIEMFDSENNSFIDNLVLRNEFKGFLLDFSSRNYILNNSINRNSESGIIIKSSWGHSFSVENIIENNTISSNGNNGIYIKQGNNTFLGNSISGSKCNLNLEGDSIWKFNQTFDSFNTVDGKPVYYLNGVSGQIIESSQNPGFIGVVNSLNVTVRDINISNSKNSHGILFVNTTNSTLDNVSVNNTCLNGILLYSSNNNIISNTGTHSNPQHGIILQNSAGNLLDGLKSESNANRGIYLLSSINNTVLRANASGNLFGIFLDYSSNNNTIENSFSTYSNTGIYLSSSINNTVKNNTFKHNTVYGILIDLSNNNSVIGNNFSYNGRGASIGGSKYNVLRDNIFSHSVLYGSGLIASNSDHNHFINNTMSNNGVGIRLEYSHQNTVENNSAFNNYGSGGIYLYGSKNNTIKGNNVKSNKNGISIVTWWGEPVTSNFLSGNIFCSNSVTDIVNYTKGNWGEENTCDTTNIWNDTGTTGCTYNCSGVTITSTQATPSYTPTGYVLGGQPKRDQVKSLSSEDQTDFFNSGEVSVTASLSKVLPNSIESTKIQIEKIETIIHKVKNKISKVRIRNQIYSTVDLLSSIIKDMPQTISLVLAAEGNEFMVSSSGMNNPPMVTISSNGGGSNDESYNIWNESIIVDVDGSKEINTTVGDLKVTGKLYLYAELYSPSGQLLAYGVYPFYISQDDLALVMDTDKKIYKPGETVNISGYVQNKGNASKDIEFNISLDGSTIHYKTTNLNPNEKYPFNEIISAPGSSFTLASKVDGINITEYITVEQPSINASINAPAIVGLKEFEVEISIENTGNVSVDLDISGMNKTWNVSIPGGGMGFLKANMSIRENTTIQIHISGDVNQTLEKFIEFGERVLLNVTPEDVYAEGMVEISYSILNNGSLDSEFNATFNMENQKTEKAVYLTPGANLTESLYFNLSKGIHILKCTSPFWNDTVEINVEGRAEFEIKLPENLTFTLGQKVNLSIPVKNIGGKEGEANIHLQSLGLFDEFNTSWIERGEELDIEFPLTIPDDVEAKNYTLHIDLNGKKHNTSFLVLGAKIDVIAHLDKMYYEEGENAILTLDITNQNNIDLGLFSRVQFNGYENINYFNLSGYGSENLTFTVPVNFIGDNKMLYSIYMTSGRSLYINSIYVHEKASAEAGIILYTDKQVYDIGENVIININTTLSGELNLSAPKFSYSNNQTDNDSFQLVFTIPELLTGTYYIEYSYNNYSFSLPFDVNGYFARILELVLDKDEYKSGDNFTIMGLVEVNKDFNATLNITILDPNSSVIGEFIANQRFTRGNNIISYTNTFKTQRSGIHAISPNIIIDLTGYSPVSVVSGLRYFDGNVSSQVLPETPTTRGAASGGGGGGGADEAAAFISKIGANETGTVEFSPTLSPYVSGMEITVNKEVFAISISLKNPSSQPFGTTEITKGLVYKYIDIEKSASLTDDDIVNAVIKFMVELEWLEANDIDKETVTLLRFHNGQWEGLATIIIDEDDDYIYYQAETPGFSYFAITGEQGSGLVIEEEEEITIPFFPLISEPPSEEVGEDEEILEPPIEVVIEEIEEKPSAGLPVMAIFLIIILAGGAGVYYWKFMFKK